MTDTPNRPPLWQVMHEARVLGEADRFTKAAEIRALRDWLVPEEAEPTGMRPCGDTYSAQSIKRGERQRLRALLTTEADRAERVMADLSPLAQAVMIAATNGNTNVVNDPVYRQCIAAALRAAADQVECVDPDDNAFAAGYDTALSDILAIAAELEAHHG